MGWWVACCVYTERKCVGVNGLPGLQRQGVGAGSLSSPSENHAHVPALFEEKAFVLLPDLTILPEQSSVWATHHNNQLKWHSESDIQGFVRQALGDIIAAAGLQNRIELANELGVVDLRVDIWLVLTNGVPIGVVEVKKPGKTVMNSPNLFGQIFDYMLQLQAFHGLSTPFGIVTTFQQWRVCWLPDGDSLAENTAVRQPKLEQHSTDAEKVEDEDEDDDCKEEMSVGELTVQRFKLVVAARRILPPFCPCSLLLARSRSLWSCLCVLRCVHGTRVLQHDDELLVPTLVSLLHKMMYVLVLPVKLFDSARPYIVVTDTSWVWKSLTFPENLRFSSRQMPQANATQLCLLKDFRGGVDGRVWLACTTAGRACVIKFASSEGHVSDDEQWKKLESERVLWAKINCEPRVRLQRFAGHWALVMPFLRHATQDDLKSEETRKAVVAAVTAFADKGYFQEDASLRHVGWLSPERWVVALLC